MIWHKLLVLILTQNIPFVLFTYSTTPIVPEEIICHIHGLSQVKNASNSEKKYFNCTLQCKEGIHCAVCFSQQKHPEVTTFGKTKCAIQILNFTPSASDDIILNHQSKIIPNEQSAGFNYSEDLIPTRVVSSNSALNNVASEQLISIKAQVVNIAATKAVNTQYQGTLKKQEVLIRIIIHF